MTLEAIKRAITELPEREKSSLLAWLNEQDARAWDNQVKEDFSAGGAGMALIERWDAEINAGRSVPIEEFLAHREAVNKVK
jgi:predicted transcriptional regulator